MEKSANYFTVGLFVSLSLLALVGFVIWLAGAHHLGGYDRYTVYFTDPVGSLSGDATVTYMGVDVGRIVKTRLAKDRSDLVKVDIEVKSDTPVTADTVAQIDMQGITGQGHIELSTPKIGAKPPETPEGEKYPVLHGRPSSLAQFMDDMPKLGKQLSHTLDAINTFTQGSTKTVKSIKALSDSLKEDPSQILHGSPGGASGKGVEIPK